MRSKYLYRVRAVFVLTSPLTGEEIEDVRTWHYQSKFSAKGRLEKCQNGWSEEWFTDSGERRVTRHAPARSVTFERSEPVTWPTAPAASSVTA